jgi:hypothetical protein
MTPTADDLHRWLGERWKAYNDLLRRYGNGVRPSWVSAELAWLGESITRLEQRIEEMNQ